MEIDDGYATVTCNFTGDDWTFECVDTQWVLQEGNTVENCTKGNNWRIFTHYQNHQMGSCIFTGEDPGFRSEGSRPPNKTESPGFSNSNLYVPILDCFWQKKDMICTCIHFSPLPSNAKPPTKALLCCLDSALQNHTLIWETSCKTIFTKAGESCCSQVFAACFPELAAERNKDSKNDEDDFPYGKFFKPFSVLKNPWHFVSLFEARKTPGSFFLRLNFFHSIP